MRVLAVALLVFVSTLVLRAGQAPVRAAEGWDTAAAASYLDARMDAWWAKAKPLKTGDAEVKCLSCHTAVPYRGPPGAAHRDGAGRAHRARGANSRDGAAARAARRHPAAGPRPHRRQEGGVARRRGGVERGGAHAYDTLGRSGMGSDASRAAIARLWEVQRADGAWDWLNFGLEPYEANDAVFHGATLAAIAAGTSAGRHASQDATGKAGVERLQRYLRTTSRRSASSTRPGRSWRRHGCPASSTPHRPTRSSASWSRRSALDGGWSMADLGPWRWTKAAAPYAPPGTTDAALLGASDGYATGLALHAMKHSGVGRPRPGHAKGIAWLVANQKAGKPDDPSWAPWRAHSLNFDREHGGEKGEPWRRMFMSDLATAFAVLALTD